MSKKIFTDKEIKQLSSNPYVKFVSSKAITYTDAFKQLFILENNKGKLPREIFEECGFDVTVIGIQRVESSGKRWRANYQEN
uniref:HTH domain-containing protein n=1 Tax=Paenibacillus sp. FSL K6-0276 TaxID=2921450 RepID=UPI00403F8DCF